MSNANHIVFPYDFSVQGRKVAEFVRAHALRTDGKVSLLGVIPPAWMPAPPAMPVAAAEPAQEGVVRAQLANSLTKELADVNVDRIVLHGDPAYKIVEFAQANSADLIMMPTHGTGLFRSALIGSVTSKVIHDSTCPIWTAAHAEEQTARRQPASVLCALDTTPDAASVLHWAADYANRMGAILRILHVVPAISDWLGMPGDRELQEEMRATAKSRIEAIRADVGVPAAQIRIAIGPVSPTVSEEARIGGDDVIILGRGAAQGSFSHLRSHLYSIVGESPCPVISV